MSTSKANSELFKNAVCDARAIRRAALENAKITLEEAFAPRLKELLNAKLKEEINDTDDSLPVNPDPVADNSNASSEEQITSDELDEILKELEGEIENPDSVPPAEPSAVSDTPVPAPATVDAPAPAAPAPSDVPLDPAAVAPAAAPVPETPSAAAPSEVPAPAPENDPTKDVDEEIDLNELLNSLNEDDVAVNEDTDIVAEEKECENDEKEEKSEKEEEIDEEVVKENNDLKSQLNEAVKTVKILQEQLNEVNLLNAKLLYTNKLFKKSSLTNAQKMKIVEAFDLTRTIREVKLTYSNFAESMNLGGSVVGEKSKNTTVNTITEGLASKPVASTKPATVIVESVDMASRFQKLAGIKKKK